MSLSVCGNDAYSCEKLRPFNKYRIFLSFSMENASEYDFTCTNCTLFV